MNWYKTSVIRHHNGLFWWSLMNTASKLPEWIRHKIQNTRFKERIGNTLSRETALVSLVPSQLRYINRWILPALPRLLTLGTLLASFALLAIIDRETSQDQGILPRLRQSAVFFSAVAFSPAWRGAWCWPTDSYATEEKTGNVEINFPMKKLPNIHDSVHYSAVK